MVVGFLIDYLVCLVFAGFGFGLPICLWVVLGFCLRVRFMLCLLSVQFTLDVLALVVVACGRLVWFDLWSRLIAFLLF